MDLKTQWKLLSKNIKLKEDNYNIKFGSDIDKNIYDYVQIQIKFKNFKFTSFVKKV